MANDKGFGGGLDGRVAEIERKERGPAPIYTVATVPAASKLTGRSIYVSNGAAGNPVLAFSNGTNWLRCDTLAVIS